MRLYRFSNVFIPTSTMTDENDLEIVTEDNKNKGQGDRKAHLITPMGDLKDIKKGAQDEIKQDDDEEEVNERRPDLVLVLQDSGNKSNEKDLNSFFASVLNLGLEVQLVPGMMKIHRDLVFANIFASTSFLINNGHVYNYRRYFADSHLQLVPKTTNCLGKLFPCFINSREKDHLTLVRSKYPPPSGFSTFERSNIVFNALKYAPFDKKANTLGLERLLERRIVLDAFALHDGPYFFHNEQEVNKTLNARQILNRYWASWANIFSVQPLHLINEYLGDKVAFLFTFYGWYNFALLVFAIVGGLTSLISYSNSDESYYTLKEKVCSKHNNSFVCPRCSNYTICGFERLEEYCMTAKIIRYIDTPYYQIYSAFGPIWCLVFISIFRRLEEYYGWFWETGNRQVLREGVFNLGGLTFSFMDPYNLTMIGIHTGVVAIMTAILGAIVLFLKFIIERRQNAWLKLEFLPENNTVFMGHYINVAFFTAILFVFVFVIECVAGALIVFLTKLLRYKTQERYEQSIARKWTLVFIVTLCPPFFYWGFIKGTFYFSPNWSYGYKSDITNLNGIAGSHCGPFPCTMEYLIVFGGIFVLKDVVLRFILILVDILFRGRTDYNQGMNLNFRVPTWEREYRLQNITDQTIIRKYFQLITQIGLMVVFGVGFYMAPAINFILNIIDIRKEARQFLRHSRRPLLKKYSKSPWIDIVMVMALASVFIHALMVVRNTYTIERYVYGKDNNGNFSKFFDYVMKEFNVNAYKKDQPLRDTRHYSIGPNTEAIQKEFFNIKGDKPKEICYFPGQVTQHLDKKTYSVYYTRSKTYNQNGYTTNKGWYTYSRKHSYLNVWWFYYNPNDIWRTYSRSYWASYWKWGQLTKVKTYSVYFTKYSIDYYERCRLPCAKLNYYRMMYTICFIGFVFFLMTFSYYVFCCFKSSVMTRAQVLEERLKQTHRDRKRYVNSDLI